MGLKSKGAEFGDTCFSPVRRPLQFAARPEAYGTEDLAFPSGFHSGESKPSQLVGMEENANQRSKK